jgi:hypothetical protein
MSDGPTPAPEEGADLGMPTDLRPVSALEWTTADTDPVLTSQVPPGSPSMSPEGEDLDLRMGWDRFEKLSLELFKHVYGARDVKFRRYGTQGQAQHGIDLAGRDPDGSYIVVQCKEYQELTAADLRAAVKSFTEGTRPFQAHTFVLVTSASTQSTQLAHELANLQNAHVDIKLDLWGSEILNNHLRHYADIVTRFWTRETAERFCTAAPASGVPAPPPDRQEQADRILLGPLNTGDVKQTLRTAEAARADSPRRAAELFGQVAERLATEGFYGHSFVLRRRQLDVMADAAMAEDAVALAAELAVAALMHGDHHDARFLDNLLAKLDNNADPDGAGTPARRRHRQLIDAAVNDTMRTVGSPTELPSVLPNAVDVEDPAYHPTLVLHLAEYLFATEPASVHKIQDIIETAIERVEQDAPASSIKLRLRLVRAEYDDNERRGLLKSARRHSVPGHEAALISAREARRCALAGCAEDASEAWRDAIHKAIHAGLCDDAADWLYAIRALNTRYGPLTVDLNDEHRLAQALRGTSSNRILDRNRDPREAAMSALVRGDFPWAVLFAKRWLIDSCVTGAWEQELQAAMILADIYADNREPACAAALYQRVGVSKKAAELAGNVGDLVLPTTSWVDQPWWVVHVQAAQVSAQKDLLDTQTANSRLAELIDLTRRGRSGELMDSPYGSLTQQAAKSACELAFLGTEQQAQEVLDLLSADVERPKNRISLTDDEHADACVNIALAHPGLAHTALTRLVDLASFDAKPAQAALVRNEVLALLSDDEEDWSVASGLRDVLSVDAKVALRERIISMAEKGQYLADVALMAIDPSHALVLQRARAARDSILTRPDPDSSSTTFGTEIRREARLVSLLPPDEVQSCLGKLMAVASDTNEVASNRQDALIGASLLVPGQSSAVRVDVFEKARLFAIGDLDGSAFDEYTRDPHPLSAFKIRLGVASLQGAGLRLAYAAADDPEQHNWVLGHAFELLRSDVRNDIVAAAIVIYELPPEITSSVNAALLFNNVNYAVRQTAVLLALRHPERYETNLNEIAAGPNYRMRRTLAEGIARLEGALPDPLIPVCSTLRQDCRYSVRNALHNLRQEARASVDVHGTSSSHGSCCP